MSISITQDISAQVTEKLQINELAGEKVNEVIGIGATDFLVKFLRGVNASHGNKHGFPRTNFFAKQAKSVNYVAGKDGVTIGIGEIGYRQRVKGGPIRPTGGRKYLTIAAIAEAYGHRARGPGIPPLRFAFSKNESGKMQPSLIEAERTTLKTSKRKKDSGRLVKDKERGGKVWFWLISKANQKPDPSAFPKDGEIEGAALKALDSYVNRLLKKR